MRSAVEGIVREREREDKKCPRVIVQLADCSNPARSYYHGWLEGAFAAIMSVCRQ